MKLSFWEHIKQLRATLIGSGLSLLLCTLLAFCFYPTLYRFLLPPNISCLILSPLEGFATTLKLSFWTGLVVSSPLTLFFLLRFFLPAFHRREKRLILPFFLLSFSLMTLGALFAYYLTLPLILNFFTRFNASIGTNAWTLSSVISFTLWILLGHALAFETFALGLLLVHFHILAPPHFKKGRPYTIVAIFITSAILTPPDVLSQLMMAGPLLLFYELAFFYARWRHKRRVYLGDVARPS